VWDNNTTHVRFRPVIRVKTRCLLRLNAGATAIPSERRNHPPDVLSLGIKAAPFISSVEQGQGFLHTRLKQITLRLMLFQENPRQPLGNHICNVITFAQSVGAVFTSRWRSGEGGEVLNTFVVAFHWLVQAHATPFILLLPPESDAREEGVNWFCRIDGALGVGWEGPRRPLSFWVSGPQTELMICESWMADVGDAEWRRSQLPPRARCGFCHANKLGKYE